MLLYKNRGIKTIALASAATVLALIAACADTPTRDCRVGADCASGVCDVDGKCTTNPTPGGSEGGTDADASPSVDAPASDAPADSSLLGCKPNKDGTITRDEVPIAAGLHATYKVGKNEDVSTAGTPGVGGKRVWDFSTALASDVSVLVETQSLTGKWYATKFPGASYASKLQEGSDLLGVFETSPGALLLRGVVSPSDMPSSSKTELTNTPAVSVLKFPLTMSATWNTDTKVGGTAQGVALFGTYDEKYTSTVDASGTLKTPLGTFDVLRVKVVLVRTIGFLAPKTIRTFAFVTECYGTIATVTSTEDETNEEFTRAAEIRRISP